MGIAEYTQMIINIKNSKKTSEQDKDYLIAKIKQAMASDTN